MQGGYVKMKQRHCTYCKKPIKKGFVCGECKKQNRKDWYIKRKLKLKEHKAYLKNKPDILRRVKEYDKKNKERRNWQSLKRKQIRNPTCTFQKGCYCTNKVILALDNKNNKCLFYDDRKKCPKFQKKYDLK